MSETDGWEISDRHLVNQIQHGDLRKDSTLHVIGVISNPVRFHSRYRLFRKWLEGMKKTPHVKVYVVELAYGDRHHEVTEAGNPEHLQLRTKHELWHKENLINLAVKHLLPKNWKYLCWSDCDISFRDPNWALETIQQLQTYPVVQPWQDCADLGYHGSILHHFKSFCHVHRLGVRKQTHPGEPYLYAHSGFAWACTRAFWESMGAKLMEFPILGSADHHMAWGMIGQIESSIHGKMSDAFKRRCKEWERGAFRATQGNLGFTPGRIEHFFHGPKKRRFYRERWDIFIKHGFNPDTDLDYDDQGLLYLVGKPELASDIRSYMRARSEDSIEQE